ncbi:hypothetical protein KKG41_06170, partial [Patescibacteria group bacterium]|nr:hypothetical protein [Patescibacteria group bacterium]
RIGETRPGCFYLNGHKGEHFVVPKIIERSDQGSIYEIEEYLAGPTLWDKYGQEGEFVLSDKLWDLLLSAFWEFQTVTSQLPLEKKYSIKNIIKHFEKAKKIIPDHHVVLEFISKHEAEWSSSFPSKWKFALDNLILTKDNKVGLIDNVNVGLRFLSYDIGWIIWPGWVHMSTEQYDSSIKEYISYLDLIEKKFYITCPQDFQYIQHVKKYYWLSIFERIIGSLYDVVNQTKHLKSAGIIKGSQREKLHVQFLLKLLGIVLKRNII